MIHISIKSYVDPEFKAFSTTSACPKKTVLNRRFHLAYISQTVKIPVNGSQRFFHRVVAIHADHSIGQIELHKMFKDVLFQPFLKPFYGRYPASKEN
jgi:hypothetical protein